MNIKLLAAVAMGMALSTAMAQPQTGTVQPQTAVTTATPSTFQTEEDKLSYSIGADLGKNFKQQGIAINPSAMTKGMMDGMNGQLKMTDEQMKEVLTNFQKKLMAKRTQAHQKKALENKSKGEDFLRDNKSKTGVVSLSSGLQYMVIEKGTGAKPSKDDTVTVEYTGRLINGTIFDSTDKTGKPATFKVSQVIPGWTEALQLMPAGSTWEIFVPANLAYGERSVGGPIGPNETLIFKIHLISVDKKQS